MLIKKPKKYGRSKRAKHIGRKRRPGGETYLAAMKWINSSDGMGTRRTTATKRPASGRARTDSTCTYVIVSPGCVWVLPAPRQQDSRTSGIPHVRPSAEIVQHFNSVP